MRKNSVFYVNPGVKFGFSPTVLHGINDSVKRNALCAKIAFIWAGKAPVLFAEQYFLAVWAAFHCSDLSLMCTEVLSYASFAVFGISKERANFQDIVL